jgi:hypothetical protein
VRDANGQALVYNIKETAMPIYDRPTKSLMADWAKEHLKPGETFSKSDPARWFSDKYPNIKRNTVGMHVEGMSINNHVRKHQRQH